MTSSSNLHKLNIYAIYALVFFLPLFEAPKNIAVALVLLLWILTSLLSSNEQREWSKWETSVLFIILSGLASTYLGYYPSDKGIIGVGDILSYSLLFVIVRQAALTDSQKLILIIIAIISTVVTLLMGYWLHYFKGETSHLQLNSVGHVNHSGIYLAIIITTSIAMLVRKFTTKGKLILLLALSFLVSSLLIMSARGAIIPVLIFIFTIVIFRHQPARSKIALTLVSIFSIVLLLVLFEGFIDKTAGNFSTGSYSSKRIELANTAITSAQMAPILGVGLNNFGKITEADVKTWVESNGATYNSFNYFYSSHAHNLYFNTLATQGVFGLLSYAAFLTMLGYHLFTHRPQNKPNIEWLWLTALGAFFVVVIGGFFNTTLHHEHGMLAMIIFGLWLNSTSNDNSILIRL